jgi:glycosyltransferase involved in cell wall biosynthesis
LPNVVVSAGREHRDYTTLTEALPTDASLYVADHSNFSPNAKGRHPSTWPIGTKRAALDPSELRDLYSRAALVVVPVVETTFPAGITTVLEAMAMGKAVVVSATDGLRGVLDDDGSVVFVAPADAAALQRAITSLLADPAKRSAIGRRARRTVLEKYSLDAYVDALARHLDEVAAESPAKNSVG